MISDDDNDAQMIFGDLGCLKLPDICLTAEEKPWKNLTQETCPDRGSNPGTLHDRHACWRLAHSGGLSLPLAFYFSQRVKYCLSKKSYKLYNWQETMGGKKERRQIIGNILITVICIYHCDNGRLQYVPLTKKWLELLQNND